MKRLKLIYNPGSGNKTFKASLDSVVDVLQKGGYWVDLCRTSKPADIDAYIGSVRDEEPNAIVICGGDGSINLTVNAMRAYGLNAPLGIIPAGTANDFASFIKIPTDFTDAAKVISKGRITNIDLGKVNGRYFINVCAAGMFTNISQKIDANFKNTFGKLAYYVKGVEQLPNFMPLPVRITNSKTVLEENIFFFFALNSSGTGGFDKLSPGASISDGLFDFIAFRERPIHELAVLFVKVLSGEYLDDHRVVFFRDNQITIELTQEMANASLLETDVDGEAGPDLPVKIVNEKQVQKIFIP